MLDKTKKEKIMNASLEEFSEFGFDKASTDRISQRAGVSKGLIFHYFGSKENLYMITMNACVDDVLHEFDNVEFVEKDFISKLMKVMKVKYDFFIKHPLHYKLMINGFYDSPKKLKKKLEHRYVELKQVSYGYIVDMIKELSVKQGISVEDIVTLIASVTSVVEGKYINLITSESSTFECYDEVKEEYIRLMNIVMYGILQ